MRFAARQTVPALLVSLCAVIVAAFGATPIAAAQPTTTEGQKPAPNSAQCQNHDRPPPPIDTSEEPKPGEPSPQPLPVPDEPVGGTRMGECGLVQPPNATAQIPDIASASWVIADIDSGAVLAAKDPHARERPASLIKVLLAIVVIRELRLEQVVEGTAEDAAQEGTKVGVGPGGKYTVRQLLFALVMRSGNDAAFALARELGGMKVALAKMNTLAKELGALDTRAATPSGLDGPGMSTSAYDLSLLVRAAMKHKEFAEAVSTKSIDFPGYGTKPGYKVNNDNRLLGKYPGFLGGKTGFTDDARHTYLGTAKQGTRRLSVVLLRGEPTPVPLGDQAAKLLDYGFALAKAKTKPVGQLVDKAPEAQRKQDAVNGAPSAEGSSPSSEAAAMSPDANRSAFGTYGAPLVAAAGVAILISFALWIRRKRARTARTA
ncbi:D-alanyl-D-alanine carboxypeptidase family protein [Actinokineospora xionganensis]|uniref:D-alanyl-D-alanine carboxypeptidase family protein n=1 Tax=Actinokineospora xionganensis TaxID=2684470 RepID=UPI0028A9AC79|nr:D-alanyl-D-alanine carboxypeptidase family protein [Actinokineospora xionganensis]